MEREEGANRYNHINGEIELELNIILGLKYYGHHVKSRIIIKTEPLKTCDMIKMCDSQTSFQF